MGVPTEITLDELRIRDVATCPFDLRRRDIDPHGFVAASDLPGRGNAVSTADVEDPGSWLETAEHRGQPTHPRPYALRRLERGIAVATAS